MDVSVVIPLFNKADYVLDAIRSAANQSSPPREIVVVDDGSSDGGAEKVEASGCPLVRLYRQENAGVSRARNRGCEVASSEYVAFLDADDLWHPDHLAVLSRLADAVPTANLFGTAYEEAWEDGRRFLVRLPGCQAGILDDYFGVSRYFPLVFTSSIMVRRRALLATGGFPEGIAHGEDLDAWARLVLSADMAYSPECTVHYRKGVAGQATGKSEIPRPPILDTLLGFLSKGGVGGSRREEIRSYLGAQFPLYLTMRRVSEKEFCALIGRHGLRVFGLPGGLWSALRRVGLLRRTVHFLLRVRGKLLKTPEVFGWLMRGGRFVVRQPCPAGGVEQ